jgi:hypothetical protein
MIIKLIWTTHTKKVGSLGFRVKRTIRIESVPLNGDHLSIINPLAGQTVYKFSLGGDNWRICKNWKFNFQHLLDESLNRETKNQRSKFVMPTCWIRDASAYFL